MVSTRKHLLLALSTTVPVTSRPPLAPQGAKYLSDIGAWVIPFSGRLFITHPTVIRPATKKKDIETGEDQKSE
jgi:hypothetical protein